MSDPGDFYEEQEHESHVAREDADADARMREQKAEYPTPAVFDGPFQCGCGASFVPAKVGIRPGDYGDVILFQSECPACHSTHTIHEDPVVGALAPALADLDARLPSLEVARRARIEAEAEG